MTAPLLSLRGVSCRFSVSRGLFRPARMLDALVDIDFDLSRGETVGIVGESGCGKSTLAKVALGLIEPTAGEVLLDDLPARVQTRLSIARRIQPVFQDPYSSLNPSRTIRDIVGRGLRIHDPGGSVSRRARVEAMLDLVGLPERLADSYPGELSGGQRQRVAIARALVLEPEVLVCDEPTSALDVSIQAQVLNLLLDLRERLHLTMLFISHDLAVVEHMASRVVVMYLGRIVEMAPASALFQTPRHPYTRALFASVLEPRAGARVQTAPLGRGAADPFANSEGCAFAPRCPLVSERCRVERPALRSANGHAVACHFA